MATIRVLSRQDLERLFTPTGKRLLRDEEMMPYREAISALSAEEPGGVVELEENENARAVMMRLHRAARDLNRAIRFQRPGRDQRELHFRLQTEEEAARIQERGRRQTQARRAKRLP